MSAKAIERSGINLLPPEVISTRKLAAQRRLMFGGFAIFLVAMAGLWLLRNMELNKQEEREADANARAAVVNRQVTALNEFALLDTTVKQKGQLLATVMTKDVAWSRLMDEVLGVIPADSTITGFSAAAEGFGNAQSTAATAPPVAGQPASVQGAGTPPAVAAPVVRFGTFNFTATGHSFPGVAQWIDQLSTIPSMRNVWVPTATKGSATSGGGDVLNYETTSDLNEMAGSGRFQIGVSK
ncbi:MAG: PilN domain-containing protein [Actinomycetota bacterium]